MKLQRNIKKEVYMETDTGLQPETGEGEDEEEEGGYDENLDGSGISQSIPTVGSGLLNVELKVVIILKENRVMIGVLSADCDPFYKTMESDLAAALIEVPILVEEARKKFSASAWSSMAPPAVASASQ